MISAKTARIYPVFDDLEMEALQIFFIQAFYKPAAYWYRLYMFFIISLFP
jgi:hypothetical protein